MSRLIPRAVAYAKNVNAIENHNFQGWLQRTVEYEDLVHWAREGKDSWTVPKVEPVGMRGFIHSLLP